MKIKEELLNIDIAILTLQAEIDKLNSKKDKLLEENLNLKDDLSLTGFGGSTLEMSPNFDGWDSSDGDNILYLELFDNNGGCIYEEFSIVDMIAMRDYLSDKIDKLK